MNKKFLLGCLVVFLVIFILEWLIHGVLLASIYQATAHLWRPEAEMKMGVMMVVQVITAIFFTLIFSKGYEGKGPMEGLRYGLLVGILMAVPMGYGSYAVMDIPYSLALQWFIYGVIEYSIAGVAVAAVYGNQAMVSRKSAA